MLEKGEFDLYKQENLNSNDRRAAITILRLARRRTMEQGGHRKESKERKVVFNDVRGSENEYAYRKILKEHFRISPPSSPLQYTNIVI